MFRSQYLSREIENAIGNAYQMNKIVVVTVNVENLLDESNTPFLEFLEAVGEPESLRFIQIKSHNGSSETLINATVINSGFGLLFDDKNYTYEWTWDENAVYWSDVHVSIIGRSSLLSIIWNFNHPENIVYDQVLEKLQASFESSGPINKSVVRLEQDEGSNLNIRTYADISRVDQSDAMMGVWYFVYYLYNNRYYTVIIKTSTPTIDVSYLEISSLYRVYKTRFTNSDYDLTNILRHEIGNEGIYELSLNSVNCNFISAMLDLPNEYDRIDNSFQFAGGAIPYMRIYMNTIKESVRVFRALFNLFDAGGKIISFRRLTLIFYVNGQVIQNGRLLLEEFEPVAKGLVNADVIGVTTTRLETLIADKEPILIGDTNEISDLWRTFHTSFHFKAVNRIYHVTRETPMTSGTSSVTIQMTTVTDNGTPIIINALFATDAPGSTSWRSCILSLEHIIPEEVARELWILRDSAQSGIDFPQSVAELLVSKCPNRDSINTAYGEVYQILGCCYREELSRWYITLLACEPLEKLDFYLLKFVIEYPISSQSYRMFYISYIS